MSVPETFKTLVSTIKRAEELEKDSKEESKIIAYYCRLHVVTKGMKLRGSSNNPEDSKFLSVQFDILERMKKTTTIVPEKGPELCKNFALAVFNKADEEDRSGFADKTTAKIFYSAGTFFDILEQFGELDKESQEKRRFAKWKATEILNALREGRTPAPGGFGEKAPDSSIGSEPPVDHPDISGLHIPAAPTVAPSPLLTSNIPQAPFMNPPAPTAAHYTPPSAEKTAGPATVVANNKAQFYQSPPATYVAPPYNNADPRVKDTIELCSFAVASLKKNDLKTARERLTEALKRLG